MIIIRTDLNKNFEPNEHEFGTTTKRKMNESHVTPAFVCCNYLGYNGGVIRLPDGRDNHIIERYWTMSIRLEILLLSNQKYYLMYSHASS